MSKLIMYRGDAATFDAVALDKDGDPIDVTSGTQFFSVKNNARDTDANAIFRKTLGSGITVVNGPLGIVTITLLNADTEGVYAPAEYVWDWQYVTVGGNVTTLQAGKLLILADVSIATS